MENKSKPIGYWLKEVDRLIEDGLDRALVERDMTRRQWQVMNVLRGAAHDDNGLVTALRPFWGPRHDGAGGDRRGADPPWLGGP